MVLILEFPGQLICYIINYTTYSSNANLEGWLWFTEPDEPAFIYHTQENAVVNFNVVVVALMFSHASSEGSGVSLLNVSLDVDVNQEISQAPQIRCLYFSGHN